MRGAVAPLEREPKPLRKVPPVKRVLSMALSSDPVRSTLPSSRRKVPKVDESEELDKSVPAESLVSEMKVLVP